MIFLGKELCCISFLCKNTIFMFPTCKKLNIPAFFSFFAIRMSYLLYQLLIKDPTFGFAKVLPLGKTQINSAFHSLIRTFGFAEGTPARKNSNKFGFPLAYAYLWLRRRYFRSEKLK